MAHGAAIGMVLAGLQALTSVALAAGLPAGGVPGAGASSPVPVPAGAVRVEPGGDVQAALTGLAGQGGVVILAPGLHPVRSSLDIPSGVTVAGEGKGTVLQAVAGFRGSVIANADPSIRGVILRDLTVDGGCSAAAMADPAAPPVNGILLVSMKAPDMRELRIERVTVVNCTGMGVHVKGAAGLHIEACDFSRNGGAVGQGARFNHNLYIRRITGAVIRGNRLSDSPLGNGLNISYSGDLRIEANEASGNGFRGIRAAETTGVTVTGNRTTGNGDNGIVINSEKAGCRDFRVEANVSRDNGRHGIEIRSSAEGTVRDNAASGNGQGDLSIVKSRAVVCEANRLGGE